MAFTFNPEFEPIDLSHSEEVKIHKFGQEVEDALKALESEKAEGLMNLIKVILDLVK